MNMTFMELYNIIKRRLGIPYTFFELSYKDFVEVVKNKTLRLISQTLPNRIYVPFKGKDNRVEGTNGVYKIPYNGEIVSVINMYLANSDIIAGWPLSLLNTSMEESISAVADMMQAVPNIVTSSMLYFTWEFMPPNKLKIFPCSHSFDICIVKLEVLHTDLTTIPGTFGHDIIELVLADVYDTLGDLRSKYQQVNSPFGDIQLNAESLTSKAENLRSKVLEKLASIPPNVIVSGL